MSSSSERRYLPGLLQSALDEIRSVPLRFVRFVAALEPNPILRDRRGAAFSFSVYRFQASD
jgi:hypothetical protein